MASEKKNRANAANAQKSIGPKTHSGKLAMSQNARTHGVLSAKLFLEDENSSDFDALLQSLIQDLRPAGALELILVERIAVAIWKQRRLNRAESAAIEFAREKLSHKQLIAKNLSFDDNRAYLEKDFTVLGPGEYESYEWLDRLLQELQAVKGKTLTIEALPGKYPELLQNLEVSAKNRNRSAEEHLTHSFKGDTPEQRLQSYISVLTIDASAMRASLDRRHKLTILAHHDRASRSIPETPELMTRYQTALDNELYKALKALREAQAWRQKTLDAVSAEPQEPADG